VTASAQERAAALAPLLAEARSRANDLQAEIRTHEADAHDSYVRGDTGAGDASHEKAAALRPLLGAATARVQTLEQAARALSEAAQREAGDARVAAMRGALEQALTEMREHAAQVWPAVTAAKAELKQAQAAEGRARRLEGELRQLEASLAGRTHTGWQPGTSDVRAMVESSRLLTGLLHSDEG